MTDTESAGSEPQTSEPDKRIAAARVGPIVELRSVRLAKLEYESSISSPKAEAAVSIEIHVGEVLSGATERVASEEPETEAPECELVYRLSADVSADFEDESILHAKIEFDLVYEVLTGVRPTEEEVDAFGSVSATFTGFPYIRELVQSLTVRSELPPLVLGVMRSPLDAEHDDED